MIRKIFTALILLPLAIIVISLAVANRENVILSFDPFDPAHPALTRAEVDRLKRRVGPSALVAQGAPGEAAPRLMIPPPAA